LLPASAQSHGRRRAAAEVLEAPVGDHRPEQPEEAHRPPPEQEQGVRLELLEHRERPGRPELLVPLAVPVQLERQERRALAGRLVRQIELVQREPEHELEVGTRPPAWAWAPTACAQEMRK